MHHCFNLRKLKWRLGICRLTRFHLKTCRISFALYPKAKKKKRKPFYQESYFVFVIRSYEKILKMCIFDFILKLNKSYEWQKFLTAVLRYKFCVIKTAL
jgi:hypothetical protein